MKISLVGAGPGKETLICKEARELIEDADILIGAERILRTFGKDKVCFNLYKPDEILNKIKNTGIGKDVAVLFTGDPGFFSSAKKLFNLLDRDESLKGSEIKVIPGISSMQYFLENLHITWENVCFTSLHGRKANIIGLIKNNEKVFSLFGDGEEIWETAEKLHYYGMDNVRMIIGERLSYPDENIILTDPGRFISDGIRADKLSVVLFVNDSASGTTLGFIDDGEFIRGDVPMTKSEVRTLSLAKLKLSKDSVLYDIGAGTGSVSVEAALKLVNGEVFAIEKKDAAIELIKKNKKKFAADNINIIYGTAPDVLTDLPKPTHVFIGGSGGSIKQIIDAVFKKNPGVRIVINMISLDTLDEVGSIVRENDLSSDLSLVSVARVKNVSGHRMMEGLNPVYIAVLEKKESGA